MQTLDDENRLFFVQLDFSPVPALANDVLNYLSNDLTEFKNWRNEVEVAHNSGRFWIFPTNAA